MWCIFLVKFFYSMWYFDQIPLGRWTVNSTRIKCFLMFTTSVAEFLESTKFLFKSQANVGERSLFVLSSNTMCQHLLLRLNYFDLKDNIGAKEFMWNAFIGCTFELPIHFSHCLRFNGSSDAVNPSSFFICEAFVSFSVGNCLINWG